MGGFVGSWILGKVIGGWGDKLVGGQMDKWKYKKWIRFLGDSGGGWMGAHVGAHVEPGCWRCTCGTWVLEDDG